MWEKIANNYHSWCMSNRWFYYFLSTEIKRKFSEAKRILDVGAGSGIFAEELGILFPKSEIVCLDSSYKMCKLSKGVRGDGAQLPFKDEIFDLVTFCFSLHELEIEKALGEAKRVLRKDGRVFIVDLNTEVPPFVKRMSRVFLGKIIGSEYADHLEKIWDGFKSCEEIAETLKKLGFEAEAKKGLFEIFVLAKKL